MAVFGSQTLSFVFLPVFCPLVGTPSAVAHLLFGALLQAGLVIADAQDRRTEMGGAMVP